MNKEVINNCNESLSKLNYDDAEISHLLETGVTSKITEENKPFSVEILPGDIGLDDLKLKFPVYEYNNNTIICSLKNLGVIRTFNLNKSFHFLYQEEKDLILNELIPVLKKEFTHIFNLCAI